jgi:hypothetical protein
MSVTIKHLNGDSSFLLTFTSSPPTSTDHTISTFSVLIDPWLVGPSIVTAPWFAKTVRRVPSAVKHLSELPEPDIVVVSQNKPDHCHKQTLLQLRRDGRTIIAAEPGAAKAIKSWNYFKPSNVRRLVKYDSKVRSGRSLCIPIPAPSLDGCPGEISISFVPAKQYMTGLHNAIGITYQAPRWTRSIAPMPTIDLPRQTRYFHMPLSPRTMPPASPRTPVTPLLSPTKSIDMLYSERSPLSPQQPWRRDHRPQLSRSSNTASSEFLPMSDHPVVQNVHGGDDTIVERVLDIPDKSPQLDKFKFETDPAPFTFMTGLLTPPESPAESRFMSPLRSHPSSPTLSSPTSTLFHYRSPSSNPSHQKSLSSVASMPNLISPITPARPRTVSVIYSPHGLPLSDLQPYIQNHLVRLGALPLTVLLHSFDHAQNPWYLGGNIMTGMEGGADLARALMARCWISAHDEEKDDRGLSVMQLRVRRKSVEAVKNYLYASEDGAWLRKRGWDCEVRKLDAGAEMTMGPAKSDVRTVRTNCSSKTEAPD